MATVHGVLGQISPAAGQLVVAYQVPRGKRATVQIVVTNRAAVVEAFRIAVSPGVPVDNSHYLAYDEPIEANASLVSTPIEVGSEDSGAVDVVRVRSGGGNLSFNVTGVEATES